MEVERKTHPPFELRNNQGDPAPSTFSKAEVVSGNYSPNEPFYIWVGGIGNLNVLPVGNETPVVINAIPSGTLLPIYCKAILSASTTATVLVALR